MVHSCVTLFYSCACAFGFHGTFCEVNVDDCQDHGCENGATCVDGVGNYTCLCAPNYKGVRRDRSYAPLALKICVQSILW